MREPGGRQAGWRESGLRPSRPESGAEPSAGRVLVFTLGPRAEARRHPLLPPSLQAAEVGLRQACLDSVVAAAREVGLGVDVCSPSPVAVGAAAVWRRQEGRSFAERLRAALRAAFDAGPGPLIAVGSDTPEIGPAMLSEALALLAGDPDRVVLGPSTDGGVYLIAAARPLDEALEGVRWCGRHTRQGLLTALARAGRPVVLLRPLADLDRAADLGRWLARPTAVAGPLGTWVDALRALLAGRRRPPNTSAVRATSPLRRDRPPGRAPPAPLSTS